MINLLSIFIKIITKIESNPPHHINIKYAYVVSNNPPLLSSYIILSLESLYKFKFSFLS